MGRWTGDLEQQAVPVIGHDSTDWPEDPDIGPRVRVVVDAESGRCWRVWQAASPTHAETLVFDSLDLTRRRSPAPAGWETLPADELLWYAEHPRAQRPSRAGREASRREGGDD